MTPEERKRLGVAKVRLEAAVGGPDYQNWCRSGYEVSVKRADGMPVSEMELRSLLDNLSLAVEGEDSLIDLDRNR